MLAFGLLKALDFERLGRFLFMNNS